MDLVLILLVISRRYESHLARREVGLEALEEVLMSRKSVLVALAFAFAFALPASTGQAASRIAPSVSTGSASNVTFSSAVLAGSVDPRGQETN